MKTGLAIAYIREENDDNFIVRIITGGRAVKGKPGAKIDSRIKLVNQNVFTKKIADAFSNPRGWKNYYVTLYSQLKMAKLDWYILQRFCRWYAKKTKKRHTSVWRQVNEMLQHQKLLKLA